MLIQKRADNLRARRRLSNPLGGCARSPPAGVTRRPETLPARSIVGQAADSHAGNSGDSVAAPCQAGQRIHSLQPHPTREEHGDDGDACRAQARGPSCLSACSSRSSTNHIVERVNRAVVRATPGGCSRSDPPARFRSSTGPHGGRHTRGVSRQAAAPEHQVPSAATPIRPRRAAPGRGTGPSVSRLSNALLTSTSRAGVVHR